MAKSELEGIEPEPNFVAGVTLPTKNASVISCKNNKLDILKYKIL